MKYLTIFIFFIFSYTSANENIINTELKTKIEYLKNQEDSDFENTYVSKSNNRDVIIDSGYPTSNPVLFKYFVEYIGNEFFITDIIGETETIGIPNNFFVKDYRVKVDSDFNNIGYAIRDQIDHNLEKSSSSDYINELYNNKSVFIPMGRIGLYNFSIKYNNIGQFSSRKLHYFIECNGVGTNLYENNLIFMGYYSDDLKNPKFIVIEKDKRYIYLEGNNLRNYMINKNVKCK